MTKPLTTSKTPQEKLVCQNRRVFHDYFIEARYEAGLALCGTEVKSLRQGKGSLSEAYAIIKEGEAWLIQFHIPPYDHGNRFNGDPVRPRKLLLHRKEITELHRGISRQGLTIAPIQVYFKRGRAKIQIGLARGKKLYDKRDDIKQRDDSRQMERAFSSRRKNRDD